MLIESREKSRPPQLEPSPSLWQKAKQWLGMHATVTLRELSAEELADIEAEAALEALRETERALIAPPGYPEPLELGSQAYIDPGFWGPQRTTGTSLAEDKAYQEALEIAFSMEPPHASASKLPD